ncbi:MAG: hypothetical protein M1820_000572 [Bogoriella megaspora]|nr:MAG: hypothetical protein M1820_000572 [Bogoriella megaspora]
MLGFVEDDSRYDAFVEPVGLADGSRPRNESDALEIKLMECFHGEPEGEFAAAQSISDLQRRPNAALRLIFAPIDVPKTSNWYGLCKLFEELEVPSSFISERVQSVCGSFGSRPMSDNRHCLWFHFLCKNVELTPSGAVRNVNGYGPAGQLSQADWSWQKAGFFLKWQDTLLDSTPDYSVSGTSSSRFDQVTCCFWGATQAIANRFGDIIRTPSWTDVLQDPFVILDVILDELYLLVDMQKTRLASAFGQIETQTLLHAANHESRPTEFDFAGLANIAKHNIHLGTDSTLEIAEAIHRYHCTYFSRYRDVKDNRLVHAVEDALEHKRVQFKCIHLQVLSREKRIQNLTNLAFNLVSQQNNRTVMAESRNMKVIATISLVFLPFALVTALFSTPFFSNNPGSRVWVSKDIWIFWVIIIPLTIFGPWTFFYFTTRGGRTLLNRVGSVDAMTGWRSRIKSMSGPMSRDIEMTAS